MHVCQSFARTLPGPKFNFPHLKHDIVRILVVLGINLCSQHATKTEIDSYIY